MLMLTVVFSAVLVLPVIYPDLPTGSRSALEAIDLGIRTAFFAECLRPRQRTAGSSTDTT